MLTEKEKKNTELLKKLDDYLESIPPDELFEDIESRYPDGPSLESVRGHNEV